MVTWLKRCLPEPVKQPLRAMKHRLQHFVIARWYAKEIDVERLNRLFLRHRYWYRATYVDNQLITRHNCDFVGQAPFADAYRFAADATRQQRPYWSAYFLLWAARQAARLEGDFVECGTARGFAAASVLRAIDLKALGKRFFLFDSWAGLLEEQLTDRERRELYGTRLDQVNRDYSGYFDEVRRVFGPFGCVSLIKGWVPQSLSTVDIPRVAFLHLDMNAVYPEVEALKYFWPKLSRGAWVVLDDYGQPGRLEQKQGMDGLARTLGAEIFSSPTGQGLLVKV